MEQDIKKLYKKVIKITRCIRKILIHENNELNIEKKFLNFYKNKREENLIQIFNNEIELCISENIESINCIDEIKKYLVSINNENLNNEEFLYYLSTAYEYDEELNNIYTKRKEYFNEKQKQFRNSINGIYYFNPNINERSEAKEKIKLYCDYFKNINPKNIKK